MNNWFPAALVSLLSFGLWGLFSKLAVIHIDSKSALLYQTIGVIAIGVITLSMMKFKPEINSKGFGYAILTGAAYAIGCWFYFIAASKGKIVNVVTMTALYPLVTIFLACILLKEIVTIKQWIGVCLALAAIVMMSI